MAYELFLMRFDDAPPRKGLLRAMYEAARAVVPADDPRCEVCRPRAGWFTVEVHGDIAHVSPDHAEIILDAGDPQTAPLIYALATTGDFVIANAAGRSGFVVVHRSQLKGLPPEIRRQKPPVCKSPAELARWIGLKPRRANARAASRDPQGHYAWSDRHTNRRLGRGDPDPHLPGLRADPNERYVYVQLKPGEGPLLAMDRFARFLRDAWRTKTKPLPPDAGGVGNSDWLLRLPGGQVFVPWSVTGYSWRPNTDHLIPAHIKQWLAVLRAFGKRTKRATAEIVDGKTFVSDRGDRFGLSACQSRRAGDEDG